MLKNLFGLRSSPPGAGHANLPQSDMQDSDVQQMVEILSSASSIMPFTEAEAKIATAYMIGRQFAEGDIIIHEGNRADLDYMLWILDGEATYEAMTAVASQSVTITVLGVGGTLGAMSLIDGSPRVLQGVAAMPTRCAMLTQAQLEKLCLEHPQVGVKLMSVICLIVSLTLRDLTEKFKRYIRLNSALNDELRESMPMPSLSSAPNNKS
jgi:CRP/FNR family transcriptional regulator, cyclic AMP receptor protein